MTRVLLVDDDYDFVVAVAMLLRRHGYEVITANDAVSAVSVAIKQIPDVALIDLRLPGGEGITVMERLRTLPQLAGMPVIVITGVDPEASRERALAAGAAGYLAKPASEEELLEALRVALEGHVAVSERGKGKKVLVVDDDRDLLFALTALLRGCGYKVAAAGDAVSAVSVAVQTRPDVVLLDIGLPGGKGFTVMDRLRGLPQLAGVPVVILTGLDPARYRERARRAGAAALLRKPASDEELLAALDAALAGSSPG